MVGNASAEAVGNVAVNHRAVLDFLGEGADRAFSVDAELFGDAVVADQTEVRGDACIGAVGVEAAALGFGVGDAVVVVVELFAREEDADLRGDAEAGHVEALHPAHVAHEALGLAGDVGADAGRDLAELAAPGVRDVGEEGSVAVVELLHPGVVRVTGVKAESHVGDAEHQAVGVGLDEEAAGFETLEVEVIGFNVDCGDRPDLSVRVAVAAVPDVNAETGGTGEFGVGGNGEGGAHGAVNGGGLELAGKLHDECLLLWFLVDLKT